MGLLKDERIGSDPEPKEYVIKFDFLGKDSIQYLNVVAVEKRVWKNVKLFMENKQGEDDLFDRVDTSKLNAHLNPKAAKKIAKPTTPKRNSLTASKNNSTN